jgi:hypothetical protein
VTEQPRDWDKELAEIDKMLAKGPVAPPANAPVPKGSAAQPAISAPRAAPAPMGRRAVLGTWMRALAGAVLAGAMTQWPYAHACGVPLLLYTLAAGAVVVAGVWGASASWRSRIPAAHIVSLVVAGWGVGLLASVVLPRIGYAAEQLAWVCR